MLPVELVPSLPFLPQGGQLDSTPYPAEPAEPASPATSFFPLRLSNKVLSLGEKAAEPSHTPRIRKSSQPAFDSLSTSKGEQINQNPPGTAGLALIHRQSGAARPSIKPQQPHVSILNVICAANPLVLTPRDCTRLCITSHLLSRAPVLTAITKFRPFSPALSSLSPSQHSFVLLQLPLRFDCLRVQSLASCALPSAPQTKLPGVHGTETPRRRTGTACRTPAPGI